MNYKYFFLVLPSLLICIFFGFSSSALADGDHISFGIGSYDVLDDENALDFRAEYRWGEPVFWQINPYAGLEVTSDGSIWGGAGIYADFFVTDHAYLTPSFGIGLYTDGSSELDLGFPIEFRSQIEAGYQFENHHRISVGFGHISNASLDEDNPGTEILNFYYHLPW